MAKKVNMTLGKLSLIIVPLFFALSELFHPITMDTILGEIISAEKYQLRWFVSHIFAMISIIFLPFLINQMANYIDKVKTLFTQFVLIISQIGIVALTGMLFYDFFLWDAWKAGNNELIVNFFTVINSSIVGFIFLKIGPIFFFIGLLTLLIQVLISKKFKKIYPLLVIIGLLIFGLTGPLVPVSNGHILVAFGAIIMLIGYIGIFVTDIKESIISTNS